MLMWLWLLWEIQTTNEYGSVCYIRQCLATGTPKTGVLYSL
jgi:hypothetical protein